MKAWLKGGLIGVGIGLIILLLTFFIEPFIIWMVGDILICKFIICEISLGALPDGPITLKSIIGAIVVLTISSILGSIIGWIVGKVKSRKQGI